MTGAALALVLGDGEVLVDCALVHAKASRSRAMLRRMTVVLDGTPERRTA